VPANFWQEFVITFVPLFVVIDALGNLPIVVSLSEGLARREQRRFVNIAVVTAALVGLAFLFLGQAVLRLMGISVGSFAISGGIILVVLSIRHMTTGHMVEAVKEELVAVVPIGTPLTVGPATITTLILLATQYSVYVVLISFILNIAITWLIFMVGDRVFQFMGRGGLKAFSQVFNLILAAIGVSMILRGMVLVGMVQLTL
jgi:multiple antibiotic resistance protein